MFFWFSLIVLFSLMLSPFIFIAHSEYSEYKRWCKKPQRDEFQIKWFPTKGKYAVFIHGLYLSPCGRKLEAEDIDFFNTYQEANEVIDLFLERYYEEGVKKIDGPKVFEEPRATKVKVMEDSQDELPKL